MSVDTCNWVTDYDDSIGGEGEIKCGAALHVFGDRATCTRGHEWFACLCDRPRCTGWTCRVPASLPAPKDEEPQ